MKSLIERIAADLRLDEDYVASVIRHSDRHYKIYTVPKRTGGRRVIAQASQELKSLQYWVRQQILPLFPVSAGAFAYQRGDSAARHAAHHKNSRFLFHTDVRDFFPSICPEMLTDLLSRRQTELEARGLWYPDTCQTVAAICFRQGGLCIGTVSSPAISNLVMYSFDEDMLALCAAGGWTYSRYADDIYISSRTYLPAELRETVAGALSARGFAINGKKTWFKSKKDRRRVTGLILTDTGRVSVGSKLRRDIKKMMYDRLVKGEGDPKVILGYLAWLKDVEPATYNRYLIKYAVYCENDVIETIRGEYAAAHQWGEAPAGQESQGDFGKI